MNRFLANKKRLVYWIGAPVAILGIFLLVEPVYAGIVDDAVLTLVGWIVLPIVHFLGNILLLLIEVLIGVFSFSEFIDSPAVQLGWVIIRDIANIGIVVALVIIAFSTVFRIKRYAASQLLVQLIIAAFLVNFSLVITGLIIDFGQVLMMYFVNAFSDIAAGNLTVGFGIEHMLQVSKSVAGNPAFDTGDLFGVIGAMLLAVVLLIVAIAVIIVFLVVLLQRIIYLWLLAIFSPIAWVGPLLPGGDKWGSQWWNNFTTQVFIGPVLAFGFWLSMTILAGVAANQSLIALNANQTNDDLLEAGTSDVARFVTEVSTPQAIFDFMVTIALLMGTLWMAKQAGGAAGSFAGSISGKLENAPGRMMRRAARPVTDRYNAYKGKREGVRQAGIQRFATNLSAKRDLATIGTKKARTRAIARGQRDLKGLAKADMLDAEQRYNFRRMQSSSLRDVADGKGAGKNNVAARRQAAMQLASRPDGIGEGEAGGRYINKLRGSFKGSGLSEVRNDFDDAIIKNAPTTAANSEIYNNIANKPDNVGASRMLGDILKGTLDVNVLNNDDIANNIEAAMPKGEFMTKLMDGTRNGDHLENILTKMDTKTKRRFIDDDFTKNIRDRNYDSSGKFHGEYTKQNTDKVNALARSGNVKAAFNGVRTMSDLKKMMRFMEDPKNKNAVINNINPEDLRGASGENIVKAIQRKTTSKDIEKMIEDKGRASAMKETLGSIITKREDEIVAGGDMKGSNEFVDKAYKKAEMKTSRENLTKITGDLAKAYDLESSEAVSAVIEAFRKGRLKGGNIGKTNMSSISAGHQEQTRAKLAEGLRVSDIADLADNNEDFAKDIIETMKRLGTMDTKLKALEKNYRTSHLV